MPSSGSLLPVPGVYPAGDRAVICVRVSPRPAENVRYSPEIQEQKCREWCDARGIPVVGVIQDILVSGGSPTRFDSIKRSVENDRPTHFVVSDISRWTRDHPMRYWVMRAWLDDAKIKLVSVDQSYISDEMPFAATIATAQVEANYLQRLESNKKTSEGVRRALAAGKHVGRIWGWAFDADTRRYVVDRERVVGLFTDYADGTSSHELARRYGARPGHIRSHVSAVSQREVVGEDLWRRVQARLGSDRRTQRWDARQSNLYRGLMFCPFCDQRMVHHSSAWNNYRCPAPREGHHDWTMISATTYVEPEVRRALDSLVIPDDDSDLQPPSPKMVVLPNPADIRKEIDRLTVAWSKGRLSETRYEALVAGLERQLEAETVQPPSVDEQVAVLQGLVHVDLGERLPGLGNYLNAVFREVFRPFLIGKDRHVTVEFKHPYSGWTVDPLPFPQVVHPEAS